MKLLIVIGSIFLPVALLYLNYKFKYAHLVFSVIAVVSALIFGNIAALSIYNVIANDTLFMTTIHSIFLNPLFILTGAYLGVYIVYMLVLSIKLNKKT